jgi:glycosyltransferase involved in cell wall biosynthesis
MTLPHECAGPGFRSPVSVLTDVAETGRLPQARYDSRQNNERQTPAMAAGIDCAQGEILGTMDGDLQNDPQDSRQFLANIDAGYDIVVGWRFKRQDQLVSRKIPSKIANWIIGKLTGVPSKDNGCSLKAYRGSLKQIPLYSVVLDLMVIKTVASFTSRPRLWFTLLASDAVARDAEDP